MEIIQRVLAYLQVMQKWGVFISAFGIILAVLACFVGYRAQKLWIGILGFVIGAVGGSYAALHFVDNQVVEMLIAIVAGFFVAVIAISIYMFGLALECFFFGFALAGITVPEFVSDPQVLLIVCAAVGLVMMILGIIFTKYAVVILTGIFGGIKLADFALGLLGMQDIMIFLIAAAVLSVLGILVQILTTRHYRLDRGGFVVTR